MDVYKFESYIDVLRDLTGGDSKWGSQSRLAAAAGCQRSYLSQVLKGKATLTQDQAIGISEYLGFGPEETQYFLLLVSLERASGAKLRSFYKNSLKRMREEREDLSRRFAASALNEADRQAVYYSSWLLSAVHILSGIEGFHTPSALAERLSAKKETVAAALKDLSELGLVEEFKRGHWRNTTTRLHLPKESPWTAANHMNWRQRAILNASSRRAESLHYTAVMSIAKRDIPAVRAAMMEAIDKSREVVKASSKEDVVCMTCDLFEI